MKSVWETRRTRYGPSGYKDPKGWSKMQTTLAISRWKRPAYRDKNRAMWKSRCIIKTMTEPEKAWLAAAIDGEGCILVCNVGRKRYPKKYPRIDIYNTNVPFLERASEITGTVAKPRATSYQQPLATKPCYIWSTVGLNAVSILKQILPYMIIKVEKAKRVIEEFGK